MKIQKTGFWQRLVRFTSQVTLRLYYRKVTVDIEKGLRTKRGPFIFLPNHQNTFMDAFVMHSTYLHVPMFMTRADIFKQRTAEKALNFLRMLPIYRIRDGKNSMKKNEDIFKACVGLLEQSDCLGIFPEGNHGQERRLRILKKGAARIAMEAEDKANGRLGVTFFPIGLNYEQHDGFRTDLHIQYGNSFKASEYLEAYRENPTTTLNAMRDRFRAEMEPVMIHISNKEFTKDIDMLRDTFMHAYTRDLGLNEDLPSVRFPIEKQIVAKAEAILAQDSPNARKLAENIRKYRKQLDQLKIQDRWLDLGKQSITSMIPMTLLLILGFPVYLYSRINHFLPVLPGKLLVKKFKDRMFHAPVESMTTMIVLPIMYIVQSLLVGLISGSAGLAWVYFLSLPLTGLLSLHYHDLSHRWRQFLRIRKLESKNFESLNTQREALLDTLRGEVEKVVHEGQSV